jgi:hypothetical protein
MFAARRRSPILTTRRYLEGRRVAQGYFSATILEHMAFDGFTLSPCYKTMRESLQIGLASRDRILIPFKTNARHVRNVKQSITDFIGLLKDRIGPILPFQPMRGLRDPHHVSGHLRIKMCRHRYARRSRDSGCCVYRKPRFGCSGDEVRQG